MNNIHLVVLWHMHQPQYRDPATGRYVLPWTRLHALKDYWGMVRVLEEFPAVHATFNVVPSLAAQLEEYASGHFDEPWFTLAFSPADTLSDEDKAELLRRGFQVNRENLMRRWPRYAELFDWAQQAGGGSGAHASALRDWRDLQLLSQLAWMDEEYLAQDPEVSRLSRQRLRLHRSRQADPARQADRAAGAASCPNIAARRTPGRSKFPPRRSTIRFCRCSATPTSPASPIPARRSLSRRSAIPKTLANNWCARAAITNSCSAGRRWGCGRRKGRFPTRRSSIAAELGFRWFASDEGVLGRTLNIGFGRDADGVPSNADRLYAPLRVRLGGREITGFFRDHYLSDLVGFVYSRMDAVGGRRRSAPPPAGHRRARADRPPAHSLAHSGRRECLGVLPRQRARIPAAVLPAHRRRSGHSHADGQRSRRGRRRNRDRSSISFPASWINANFDIWIGHSEDVAAWNLLRDARDFYERAMEKAQAKEGGAAVPPKRRPPSPSTPCWRPKAATGAGGSAPTTAPPMTPSSTPSIASC